MKKHSQLFCFIQIEKIDEKTLPVVLLYHYDFVDSLQKMADPDLRQRHRPKFYLALWGDGKVIWGKLAADIDRGVGAPKYPHSFNGIENGVVYFQSQISTDKVEELVSEINGFNLRQDADKVFAPFHVGSTYLFVRNDDRFYLFTVPDINWPRTVGSGCMVVAEKWQRTARLLLGVIPDQGEKVDMNDKKAICQRRRNRQ